MSTPRTIDFWFDYACPYAYLASTQLDALGRRTGAAVAYRPMLLGGVFKARGTPQTMMEGQPAAKARHNELDMRRWADVFGVALNMPAAHPMRTVEALRATLATGVDPAVVRGFFRAYWVEGREVSDPATVREVVSAAGHDADAVLARIESQEIKDALRARTEQAVALGIFGAPSFIVDDKELYWGQDRIDLIAGSPGAWFDTARIAARGTTPRTLEVYWDFSSPFAYLGSTQAAALAKRTGATLVWRPMLLGGLFKTVGQVDVPMNSWSDAKRAYVFEDMRRWAAHWGVPFRFPSRFPTNSVKALRAYLALPEARRDAFREATFRAYWAEDRDIADDAVLRELIGDDADAVLATTQSPEIKQALIDATKRAADAGVFGAPTWVVDGTELYWGQDRIPLVELALVR